MDNRVARNKNGTFAVGHKFTEEMLDKMRLAKVGMIPTVKQLEILKMGRVIRERGGYKLSEQAKQDISIRNKKMGLKFPSKKGMTYEEIYGDRAEEEKSKRVKKAKETRYKRWLLLGRPGKRPKHSGVDYANWRSKVFKRDNYICQECGKMSGKGNAVYLEVHHLKSFKNFPKLRHEVSNGLTLCKECHRVANTIQRKVEKDLLNVQIQPVMQLAIGENL